MSKSIELAVEDGCLMPILLEQCFGVAELQRQMRLAAAEVNAPFEAPIRIDKRETHSGCHTTSPRDASSCCISLKRSLAVCCSSLSAKSRIPASRLTLG